jgi:hypothetical protein
MLRAIEELVRQPNAGDLVLFGAFDGYEIVSFDDQVGAHGSAGGDQVYPFLLAPRALGLADATLENARDLHRAVLLRYAQEGLGPLRGGSGDEHPSEPDDDVPDVAR